MVKVAEALVKVTAWYDGEENALDAIKRALGRIEGVGDGEIEYQVVVAKWVERPQG